MPITFAKELRQVSVLTLCAGALSRCALKLNDEPVNILEIFGGRPSACPLAGCMDE